MSTAIQTLVLDKDADAITADSQSVAGEVKVDGVVSEVTYIPNATNAGADSNTRTMTLYNRGQAGAGTTVVATYAMSAGHDMTAYDELTFTLSVVDGALDVVAGDVLELASVHASSGLTEPGGKLTVVISSAADAALQGADHA